LFCLVSLVRYAINYCILGQSLIVSRRKKLVQSGFAAKSLRVTIRTTYSILLQSLPLITHSSNLHANEIAKTKKDDNASEEIEAQ